MSLLWSPCFHHKCWLICKDYQTIQKRVNCSLFACFVDSLQIVLGWFFVKKIHVEKMAILPSCSTCHTVFVIDLFIVLRVKSTCLFTRLGSLAWSQHGFWQLSSSRNWRFMKPLTCLPGGMGKLGQIHPAKLLYIEVGASTLKSSSTYLKLCFLKKYFVFVKEWDLFWQNKAHTNKTQYVQNRIFKNSGWSHFFYIQK